MTRAEMRLHVHIRYANGYISPIQQVEGSIVTTAELIEENVVGWGVSNVVARHDGEYYLASLPPVKQRHDGTSNERGV